MQNAKGELFFIIDSDDVLAENALKNIKIHYQSIKNNDKICGIVGLSQYIDKQEIVGDYFLRVWFKVVRGTEELCSLSSL